MCTEKQCDFKLTCGQQSLEDTWSNTKTWKPKNLTFQDTDSFFRSHSNLRLVNENTWTETLTRGWRTRLCLHWCSRCFALCLVVLKALRVIFSKSGFKLIQSCLRTMQRKLLILNICLWIWMERQTVGLPMINLFTIGAFVYCRILWRMGRLQARGQFFLSNSTAFETRHNSRNSYPYRWIFSYRIGFQGKHARKMCMCMFFGACLAVPWLHLLKLEKRSFIFG